MTAPLSVARLPPRRRRRLGLVVLVVLFTLLLLLSNLVPLAAEWLWFQTLGYERVFTTRLVAEAVLGVGVGGLVFAFLYVNLRIAQRGLVPNPLLVQYSSGATAVDVTRLLRRLALPTALGLALLFGLGAAGGWLGRASPISTPSSPACGSPGSRPWRAERWSCGEPRASVWPVTPCSRSGSTSACRCWASLSTRR